MVLRGAVLVAILLSSPSVYSELLPTSIKHCQQKAAARLRSWGSEGQWRQLVSTHPTLKRFISPTGKFGTWVYWESNVDGILQKLAVHSQYKMKAIEFNGDCGEKAREEQLPRIANAYDDVFLANLASTKKNFLMVVWSPETAYMGKSFVQLMKLSKTNRLPMQVFLDASAPEDAAKILGQKYKLPPQYFRRLNSFELAMRHVRTHTPVVYQFKKGKLLGPGWRGYRSLAEYKDLLAKNGVRR